jgi:parvulin-like peptidyl-prolyl isomerase
VWRLFRLSSGTLWLGKVTWLLVSNPLRATSLAVIALVALPVLSACNTSPGAAAEVGSTNITTGELQSQVNQSLASGALQKQQGFDRATFTRELLGHLISVDLINAAAKDHNVTVTSQDISAQQAAFVQQAGSLQALQQQAAAGGVTVAQLPGFIRYAALQQKLGTALVATLTATPAQLAAEYQKDIDQYDQLTIAQIAVKSKKLAHQILVKVRKNPAAFAALAKKYSLDTQSKANGGLVGPVGRSQVQKLLGAKVQAKPGTFVIARSSGDYVVIHIISRKVQPESTVTTQLKTALFSTQEQALLTKTIAAEAKKLGVHVSPRYGKWDSATDAVVAVPNPTVSSTATPSPSTSG